ncbi:MAG: protein kinase [Gemmataceae bacterium]
MDQSTALGRQAGDEPLPGYRLIEMIGQGGFGEVWKCEAPGGLYKAIKFVRGCEAVGSPASQERAALERMKKLRHPFLLSLERVDVIGDDLIVVMELADQSLHELYLSFRDRGMDGIPREELLAYLLEAAEALDWMHTDHDLQHLDVKPHNLFLITKHIKVADFGLVHQLSPENNLQNGRRGGVTPLYSAPEMLRGSISRHTDQYSLAVVYQQLLTGTVPFWNESIYDLMMQHLSAEPDLAALSEGDRGVVARALAKVPEHRFPSCLDFLRALKEVPAPTLRRSGQWRRIVSGENSLSQRSSSAPQSFPDTTRQLPPDPAPPPPKPTETPATGEDLPTQRIRAVTRDQLAQRDLARQALNPLAPHAPAPPLAPSQRLEEITGVMPENMPGSAPENRSTLPLKEGMPPTPTAISLPGYRFTGCLNQTSLGDLWRAEDNEGRLRRAMCLLGFVRYDARLISHFQALRDPALPPCEVHWSPAERLVLLTSWMDGTLRDRFDQRVAEGNPGIPRQELLTLLRTAAEALDGLYGRHGLQHLGINPRNLLLGGDRLWLADFGIIPLVWLPTGQPASALNGKYSAPELFDRRPSRSADQYSLALIFAEMLTGVHPRPQRPGSGQFRKVGNGPPQRSTVANRSTKLELALLQAGDRAVVTKALSVDPAERYETCTEFIEALEQVSSLQDCTLERYSELPPLIPFATLHGEMVGPETVLPSVTTLVSSLIRTRAMASARMIQAANNSRYTIQADGSWLYRCPFAIFPGAMAMKVEGFRDHWKARILEQQEGFFRLLMDVPIQRSLWARITAQAPRLEVAITTETEVTANRLTEAEIVVRYLGDPEQKKRILQTIAPQVFETIRGYLQATPEHRVGDRYAISDPVDIYPVLPELDLAPTVQGRCRNISLGGMSFRAPEKPPTEYVYLHLPQTPQALSYALLGKVLRAMEQEEGWEVAVAFNPIIPSLNLS